MQTKDYKVLLEEMRSGFREVNNQLSGFDRDLTKDRQDLGDFNIRLASVERELEQIRKSLNSNADRVKDKTSDVIEPLQSSVDKLTTQIKQKKMVVLMEALPKVTKLQVIVGSVVAAAIVLALAWHWNWK